MFNKDTDHDWKSIGESAPYYGVLTFEKYKSLTLTKETLQDFFQTGEKYIEDILFTIQNKIDPTYIPKHALDFGCGVGRVLIPLSKHFEFSTGVDVSDGMLKEAQKNCELFNITNVELLQCNGSSICLNKRFNFIHSFIVFQHIPVRRGVALFIELLDHLEENGIGVVHFTYFRNASPVDNFIYNSIKHSSVLSKAWNIFSGKSVKTPVFQMNTYNTNQLLRMLQEKNCHNIHIRFTQHGGIYYGVLIFFQKKQQIISGVE